MKDYDVISSDYQSSILESKIAVPSNILKAVLKNREELKLSRIDEGFGFYYDAKAGSKACYFIENLRHTKGKWSGNPFILAPWQVFFVMTLFSWKRKDDNFRRFREAILMVPRKNGKSALAAAIGLYMLCADGEKGPEVYCGAGSQKQAEMVHTPARNMILNNYPLKDYFKLTPNKESIICKSNGGIFEKVIKNVRDGQSPHMSICDELHEATSSHMIDAFQTGMGARQQPLLLIISTAGTNLTSPLFEKQQVLQRILDGVITDDNVFGLLYSADVKEENDWQDLEIWKTTNPNYGISLFEVYLQDQLQKAINYPSDKNMLLTKHLNLWMASNSSWIDMLKWNVCKNEDLDIEDFQGCECFIGIDLAAKSDICSKIKVFKRDGIYSIFGTHYLPSETVEKPGNDLYIRYRDEGLITQTDGATTDYQTILDEILDDCHLYDVKNIAFDPAEATFLIQSIQKELGENSKTELLEVPQRATVIHPIASEFEALYLDSKLAHNDKVLDWMASNVVKKNINSKLWTIGKQNEKNKIDGITALIMALGQAITGAKEVKVSNFEDPNFEMLVLM